MVFNADLAAAISKDFQYAEWIAQGFALLGDADQATHWLAHAVHLELGIYQPITQHSAVWRPWLDHPRFVSIFEALRENAERYAQLPVSPRALALVGQ